MAKWRPIANAFCPTGPGGGQDNSCSSQGGSGFHEPMKGHEVITRAEQYIADAGLRSRDEVAGHRHLLTDTYGRANAEAISEAMRDILPPGEGSVNPPKVRTVRKRTPKGTLGTE
jgi:hypothetical protein